MEPVVSDLDMSSRTARVRSLLGLNRNVTVLAASLFALALGEELWQAYIPAYLTALVVPAGVVGGLLWQRAPTLPLEVPYVVGAIGTAVFMLTSRHDSRMPDSTSDAEFRKSS